jgi:hypothetical protein
MNVRRLAAVALLVAIGAMLGQTAGLLAQNAQNSAAQNPTAQNPATPAPGTSTPAAQGSEASLTVQLARAEVRLAELNLARMKQMNERVPNTIIAGMVEQFEEEVARARMELSVAEKSPGGDPYLVAVARLELSLRAAESRARRALATHQKAPTVVTREDVERARQIAVITDLQLSRGKALADASREDKMQWQLEVVSDDLDRVRKYTYLLGQNRFGQFTPGGL